MAVTAQAHSSRGVDARRGKYGQLGFKTKKVIILGGKYSRLTLMHVSVDEAFVCVFVMVTVYWHTQGY